jgi:hypothetical protein
VTGRERRGSFRADRRGREDYGCGQGEFERGMKIFLNRGGAGRGNQVLTDMPQLSAEERGGSDM